MTTIEQSHQISQHKNRLHRMSTVHFCVQEQSTTKSIKRISTLSCYTGFKFYQIDKRTMPVRKRRRNMGVAKRLFNGKTNLR